MCPYPGESCRQVRRLRCSTCWWLDLPMLLYSVALYVPFLCYSKTHGKNKLREKSLWVTQTMGWEEHTAHEIRRPSWLQAAGAWDCNSWPLETRKQSRPHWHFLSSVVSQDIGSSAYIWFLYLSKPTHTAHWSSVGLTFSLWTASSRTWFTGNVSPEWLSQSWKHFFLWNSSFFFFF